MCRSLYSGTMGEKDNKGSKERRTGNEYVCEFAGDKEEFDEREKGKKRRIEERERKLGDPFRILQRASQRLTIREANYKPDSLPRCYFQRRACRIAKPPLLCSSLSLRPSLPTSLATPFDHRSCGRVNVAFFDVASVESPVNSERYVFSVFQDIEIYLKEIIIITIEERF